MTEAIEVYYSPTQLAARFGRTNRWVTDEIRKGTFGTEVIEDAGDFLVPASGVNAFIKAHRVFEETGELKPIYARNKSDAKRQMSLRRGKGANV